MKTAKRALCGVALLAGLSVLMASGVRGESAKNDASAALTARQKVVHALNRLTFGPRPGEVDRVLAQGLDKWIDQQLHPERISDSHLDARLASLRTLDMSPRELVENYPPPQVIRAIAEGRMALPNDPEKRAQYQAELERYRRRQQTQGGDEGAQPGDPPESMLPTGRVRPEQRRNVAGPRSVVTEVAQAKLLRAVYSDRQFEEVLTDFWFNHFNVFIGKGADRYLVTSYERDVIRPHVFGKFKDLLVATAQSPAMLWYLDNWQSVGPNSPFAKNQGFRNRFRQRRAMQRGPQQQQAQQPPRGLNENYARELMELHTLGVDGGYTQKDVTEVARVFTGWTLDQPRRGGGFVFRPAMHDPGSKTVLGKRISEGGQKEGQQVLDMLAHSPATAKFISTKLAQRFVADDPPATLVERMAATFRKTDGDLREVYRTMLRSPEFWDPTTYRAKIKTPLEFVASALRASGAEVENAMPLVRVLQSMGMPLYGAQPPTGYSNDAATWVNSAALLSRMNFSLGLASGRVPGVSVDPQQVLSSLPGNGRSDHDVLDLLGINLLQGELSPQTRQTIETQLHNPDNGVSGLPGPENPRALNLMTGLLLGSPEFQRR